MTHGTYKRFVDEMVGVARINVIAERIRLHGHPVRTNDRERGAPTLSSEEQELKQLFLRLSDSERECLARLIEEERAGALHDFAAFLEWALSCDELKIAWREGEVGASPFSTMHGDFVSRMSGYDWEGA